MAIELKFNTNIRYAVELILNEEVNPIVDFDNVRYSLDISHWQHGMLLWTPFNLTTQQIIGASVYTYPYAAHNILRDALANDQGTWPKPTTNTTFPNFPVPVENGYVTP